jgi:hypothetical protein
MTIEPIMVRHETAFFTRCRIEFWITDDLIASTNREVIGRRSEHTVRRGNFSGLL